MSEDTAPPPADCPVNSFNEWDPLEEVIVGTLDGATIPPADPVVVHTVPNSRVLGLALRLAGGFHYPWFLVKPARRELEGFVRLLEAEGVTVRRPDALDGRTRYRTPHWSSRGFCASCPRDNFLVIGSEIIEAPMAWRSRYFEGFAYRRLFKEYFARGARWTAAPRPALTDDLYDHDYTPPSAGPPERFVVNESEPVFDAADFVRCGQDLFVLRSNVTNRAGIGWLRRHLGDAFRIHEIESLCRQPMHIDTTFMPLAPGKLLINPDYVDPARIPPLFRSWDVLVCPPPDPVRGPVLSLCSRWLKNMNVFMLDEKRVVVDRSQTSMIRALKGWGFEPVTCAFLSYAPFGGSFHCATLDIRRRGSLQSYF